MASPVTMVFSSVLKINFIDSVFIILNNDCSFAPARWVKFFFFLFPSSCYKYSRSSSFLKTLPCHNAHIFFLLKFFLSLRSLCLLA